MVIADMIYNLAFINNLSTQLKNNNEIDPDPLISEAILKIYSQVGNPNYIKTPVFTKTDFKDDTRRKKRLEKSKPVLSNDDVKKYVPTQITRVVNDIDLIRSLVNKLTDKNYNELVPKILQALQDLDDKYNSENNEEEVKERKKKIADLIFNICSTNRFYSSNYAEIFALLANKYSYINDIFSEHINLYKLQFDNIKYVDSSDNYDEFCMINKMNEKRRAFTTFLVNLNSHQFLKKEFIIDLTKHLFELMYKLIDIDNKKNEIDEIVENIYIIFNKEYMNDYESIMINKEEHSITNFIESISLCKLKDFKSLSSRSKFKIMDLNEM